MSIKHPLIRVLAISAALATTISLSGCFTNPLEKIASGGADKLVEEVTGGKVDTAAGQLPKDFPQGIPLVSDKVTRSFSMKTDDGKVWTVGVLVSGNKDALTAKVQKKFDDAGWEQLMWSDQMGIQGGMYKKDNLSVAVSMLFDDSGEDDPAVQYVVTDSVEESD